MERCRNFKPLPIFSLFIILRDFFTARLKKVSTILPEKNVQRYSYLQLNDAGILNRK
jgi:hypothetical protein